MENKQKRIVESLGNNKKVNFILVSHAVSSKHGKIKLVFPHNGLVQFMHEKLLSYLHFSGSVLLSPFHSKRL